MASLLEYKGYLIGAIAALIVWFIQWRIQKDKLKLVYSLKKTDSFPSGTEIGQAFRILITNTGNKPVLDCKCRVHFATGKIDSFKFSADHLVSEISSKERSIDSFIPLLNPKDSLELTITCKNEISIDKPAIDVRAIGVTAKAKAEKDWTSWIVLSILGALIIWFVFFDNEKEDRTIPTTQDHIFTVLNEAGLPEIFPQIIASNPEDVSYKNTAFILFHNFLVDEKNQEKYVIGLRKLTEVDESVRPNSRSTIFYLLAKAEQFRNNKEKADEYFSKSKEVAPATYNYLMSKDGFYDLRALQKSLQNSGEPFSDSIR